MQVKFSEVDTRRLSGNNMDELMDNALVLAGHLGFDALVYDYTPVPLDHDGSMITPSVLQVRNTPSDWHSLWCEQGFYQIDPVQQLALNTVSPFVWSYQPKAETALQKVIEQRHSPVTSYLQDRQMTCGVSVPIHLPKGGFASLTGLRTGNGKYVLKDARQTLTDFSVISHALQEVAYPLFSPEMRVYPLIRLTRRERECLQWAAEGLTAKEIAEHLHRSLATVTLHLTSAMHKLGAKNRVQAVLRAAHYRLLDS
ncbi:LuxR family transcriptional regulator [Pseudomonas agarici]|uniref:LuxR family transcriptional regulator n=1 Tax=Pseudomonas agarici TaxID=46677 RepID=A0A0X1SYQ7_PSEAA|nr:LuxR family transcriptional regulator [Pseudomonas agarici]AMB84880.1 LuxR family transcriptional regulator [Pseudomonas agarici]NWB93117.1 LuxR family transcriptional regulator [Pseudomonas agarici]NWC08510.1 LuxR family transcriptional regulator [Pseudomonas agarici]SEK69324.1 LuxR family transcriptional regulator [Pseudomonas agarici]